MGSFDMIRPGWRGGITQGQSLLPPRIMHGQFLALDVHGIFFGPFPDLLGRPLNAFRQQIPATLRLQKVEVGGATASPGGGAPAGQPQPQGAAPPPLGELRIEALTPLRPGPPPLIEIAQFMGGLMKDPVVGKRYQLRSWEIKQSTTGGGPGEREQLQVLIVLGEKAQ